MCDLGQVTVPVWPLVFFILFNLNRKDDWTRSSGALLALMSSMLASELFYQSLVSRSCHGWV